MFAIIWHLIETGSQRLKTLLQRQSRLRRLLIGIGLCTSQVMIIWLLLTTTNQSLQLALAAGGILLLFYFTWLMSPRK